MTIALGFALLTVAPLPAAVVQDCPGPLAGAWFRSIYECGRVLRDGDEGPPPPPPTAHERTPPPLIREWAARYRVHGNEVTVLFDGRQRSYRQGEPVPEWRQGPASSRKLTVRDYCTADSDQAWPKRVHRVDPNCPVPFDAYVWTPGAPGMARMKRALYVGSVSGGRLSLSHDPYPRLHGPDVPVVVDGGGNRNGPIRFVGTEYHDAVGGRRMITIVERSDPDPAQTPGTPAELAGMAIARGDAARSQGDRQETVSAYGEAMRFVSNPSGPLQGQARRSFGEAMVGAGRAMAALSRARGDAEWQVAAQAASEALWHAADSGGGTPEIASRGRASNLGDVAARVEAALPNAEGRAEAERIRALSRR